MSAIIPDFSVNISQKRKIAVLDPVLALSPYGIPLVRRLAEAMELWVPKTFWHMLDNSNFYLCQPDAFNEDIQIGEIPVWQNQEAIFHALQEWERIRAETDPASMKLFWIADGPGESILPAEFEPSIIRRFEGLSSCLDRRLKSENLLTWAFRDTVALSAALPSAIILTQMHTSCSGYCAPAICSVLREWDLDHHQIDLDDEWLHLERDYFRQNMVLAGLAKLRWSGLRLAVLHIVAPAALFIDRRIDENIDIYEAGLGDVDEISYIRPSSDYWQGTKAFWYPL
jgi:hypothetical protein